MELSNFIFFGLIFMALLSIRDKRQVIIVREDPRLDAGSGCVKLMAIGILLLAITGFIVITEL